MPQRSQGVAVLVVGAAAVLLTCIFGLLSFTPGVDPAVGEVLQLLFFAGAVLTLGSFVTYFVLSRRSSTGEPPSAFDRLLGQRQAALKSVPIGLGAVFVGVLWYLTRTLGVGAGSPLAENGAAESFASIDTMGIAAFLGFGSLFLILAAYLAIRAERAAIHLAREDMEVSSS